KVVKRRCSVKKISRGGSNARRGRSAATAFSFTVSYSGSTRYFTNPPGAAPIGVTLMLAGGATVAAKGEVRKVASTPDGHGLKRQLPSALGSTCLVSTM